MKAELFQKGVCHAPRSVSLAGLPHSYDNRVPLKAGGNDTQKYRFQSVFKIEGNEKQKG
jgi:hypothetical protein